MVQRILALERIACLLGLSLSIGAGLGLAQADPEYVGPILKETILPPEVAVFQLKQYLLGRVAKPPAATTVGEWAAEAARLRQHLLHDVVFHGWPDAWVNAPPRFEDRGVIEGGIGYRIRKLRYEIVPGFYSAALLYEPEGRGGKRPAILNVNGHVGPAGKAVEYKQKRCINFARRGILALNIEWFDFGELANPENSHWFGAHLDLVGANALGLFYLEMRRGLDYLYNRADVDRERIGVTGLSGGGWQTILLSSLDPRVKVAVPVAGYSSLTAKLEARAYGDLGDLEQNGVDLLDGQDYTHLTALMAPRPTLLVHDAEDDCCFRAPLVKPLNYDAIRPFFALYGQPANFAWHENRDPGTHNYQLDNRLAAYQFFSQHFGLPPIESEIPAGQELKSADELAVGLPADNLTILGLARRMASQIQRPPVPADAAARASWAARQRQTLRSVVRYEPLNLDRAWRLANTKSKGTETLSYLLALSERGHSGLTAEAVWMKGIAAPENAPATIILDDRGMGAAVDAVCDRVDRDEQVLALDLLFTGSPWKDAEPYSYAQILDATGDRTLGLEAAELIAVAQWFRNHAEGRRLRLETSGIRSQMAALVAAALEPKLFSTLVIRGGMPTLGYLLEKPVTFQQAPDLFCLDFDQHFDVDRLAAMAAPTSISTSLLKEHDDRR